jgi:UDP-sugar pyrophosphorylase
MSTSKHAHPEAPVFGSPSEKDMKIDSNVIATYPLLLQDNMSVLNYEEKLLVKDLLAMGQQHLFATWDVPGVNDAMKHAFFEQIRVLNKGYPGGIAAYTKNAKVLLQAAKRGDNPFAGWVPKVPEGVRLEPVTEECLEYERLGIPHIGKCGFVLVAGGLGERLGYNGIKVELPSQTVTGICYLELYCQQILWMQRRHADMLLPLAIMVSDDTHDKTLALLEGGGYFGLERSQVSLMKQGKVPALLSNSAHMALSTSYVVDAKPHGHGDVHSLMHTTGTARRWKASGVTYVVFFQVWWCGVVLW